MKNGIFCCPHCGGLLGLRDKSLYCENGHCYDVAKSGYVNLLPVDKKNSVDPGDNKDMIRARVAVMSKGYYAPLAERIAAIVGECKITKILDAGCGTGYLSNAIKQAVSGSEVVGTDISKHAIEQASKLYKDVNYAVASSKRLPLKDESVGAVICAFAPVYAEEFYRVTEKDGIFVRVTPAEGHLLRLKEFLYAEPRKNEEDGESFPGYSLLFAETVRGEFCGNAEEIKALVKMTPYYYHTSAEKLARLDTLKELSVNTEFEIRTFIKI